MINSFRKYGFFFFVVSYMSCNEMNLKSGERDQSVSWEEEDTTAQVKKVSDSIVRIEPVKKDNVVNKDTVLLPPTQTVNTGSTHPEEVVKFAESLVGTPYVYASANPSVGFDCSGFITYVFNHFKIAVPRSSIDFTPVGKTVPVSEAKRGDIILFTGTNPAERHVGHMGIVVSSTGDSLSFIHSSSGKAMGVTITPLNDYYKSRFVRISRIFPQNG